MGFSYRISGTGDHTRVDYCASPCRLILCHTYSAHRRMTWRLGVEIVKAEYADAKGRMPKPSASCIPHAGLYSSRDKGFELLYRVRWRKSISGMPDLYRLVASMHRPRTIVNLNIRKAKPQIGLAYGFSLAWLSGKVGLNSED